MYTNISKIGNINKINTIIENNQEINRNIQKETIHILKTVLEKLSPSRPGILQTNRH
jgi:hypothetical protein